MRLLNYSLRWRELVVCVQPESPNRHISPDFGQTDPWRHIQCARALRLNNDKIRLDKKFNIDDKFHIDDKFGIDDKFDNFLPLYHHLCDYGFQ